MLSQSILQNVMRIIAKNVDNWRKSYFFTNEVLMPSTASAKEVKTEATRLPASWGQQIIFNTKYYLDISIFHDAWPYGPVICYFFYIFYR